ncbi:hypothetical protein MSAN_01410600 [Mycena sanguinolenta]|uniref:F-box domain-containing protein n=1 Tax=Mycena sanguinolenta TaxID=230812 RepID=A0A8H7CYH4_9AGAR|nr:hypothetical protein MSAN_01410600 [Mycena sanguinolenta]
MTTSHFPTETSYILRHPSLSCRRRGSPNQKDDCSSLEPSEFRKVAYVPGGTFFAAFPVELRVEVFRQFCGLYCPIDKVTEGPALLLQVCPAWRELAAQTPQLWTSFTLHWPMPSPNKTTFLLSAMKAWMKRSRNLPLSFKLHFPVPVDAACLELMQCILLSFHRWRDVTLYAPTASLLPLWALEPNSSPCLRTLSLETFGPSPVVLRDLRINWTQVTELDLFLIPIPTLDECLHILNEAVNLRRFSMNAACVLSSEELETLSLPKLEYLQLKLYRLAISDAPHVPLLVFLHSLSLPSLQSLNISWNVTQTPQWSNASSSKFVEFLEELGGHLETLHLGYLPLDAQQILRCLGVVPALQCFSIALPRSDREHDFIDNEFFDALTFHAGSGPTLLPILRSIRLESHGEAFNNIALLRFIASRWRYQVSPSAGQLESFDFVSPKRRVEYRPQRFQDVREGRLEVSARLKSEFTMVQALACFLNRDSYGQTICFMNGDFPPDVRSLLVLD